MRYADIQSALITAWDGAGFSLTTFYPDREYNPTGNHARLAFIPAGNDVATLGSTGTNEITGILQADILYQTGRGNGEILEKVDAVCAVFIPGHRVTYNNQQVTIVGANLRGPLSEGGWLRATVSITFSAYVQRST